MRGAGEEEERIDMFPKSNHLKGSNQAGHPKGV